MTASQTVHGGLAPAWNSPYAVAETIRAAARARDWWYDSDRNRLVLCRAADLIADLAERLENSEQRCAHLQSINDSITTLQVVRERDIAVGLIEDALEAHDEHHHTLVGFVHNPMERFMAGLP